MNLFFVPSWEQNTGTLPQEEATHCLKVLRKKVGDTISITNGKGTIAQARLLNLSVQNCKFEILQQEKVTPKPYHLHIAIAPTKNIERIEWMVEKTTEIGINEISFLLCQRSERKEVRIERLQKIAIQAIKQSKQAYLPFIHPIEPFKDFLEKRSFYTQKWIAFAGASNYLHDTLLPASSYLILIGPEGDFSAEELTLAQSKGFEPISLSSNTLRTETAALVAATLISTKNLTKESCLSELTQK